MKQKLFLLLFFVISNLICSKVFSQNILMESFDGSTFPPSGWSSSIPYDPGCCGGYPDDGWNQATSGFGYVGFSSGPNTHSGYGMAYFDCFNIDYGGTADLVTPNLDFSVFSTGYTVLSYWVYLSNWYSGDELDVYLNTNTSAGGTFLRAIYIDDYSYPSGIYGDGGWVQFTDTIPTSYTGSSNYVIFEGVSGFGYTDMYLDDVSVDHYLYPPTVTNYTYCQDQTPILPLAATGDSLRWYTSSTGGTGTYTAPTPTDSVVGRVTYYVSQTINGTESPRAAQTVTVLAKPPLPYAAITSYVYCQFEKDSILSVIGQNLLWYTTPTGGTGSALAPTPSTNTPGVFTYYVSQTVGGCEGGRLAITVTINAKPSNPTVASPLILCQNDNPNPLSATGAALLWYSTPSGGVGSSVAPVPITSFPKDTFNYYVTQTVNGCESDRSQIIVIIKQTPNALILGSAPYVCQYDTMSFTYFGSGTSGDSYQWSVPTGANILSGSGQGPLVVKFDSFGHLPLTIQVNDNGCSSPLTTYVVDVRQAPVQPFYVASDICVGQILSVEAGTVSETINNYNWDFDGADVVYGSTGPGPYGIRFNLPGPKYISLVATTNSCPSNKRTDTINVHAVGDAHIAKISNTTPCQGDTVTFTVENHNPAYLYKWSPGQFFGLDNNDGSVVGLISDNTAITLQVTTEFGCISNDTVLLNTQVCCTLNFPNAFSPNGDGKNDVFRPIIGQGHHEIQRFVVLDRWGQTMFETTDQNQGWDGKHSGVPQDIGSYYWYISYVCGDGKTYQEKGEVVLVR